MRLTIALALLLLLVLPSMALSPVEQAYVDGVNDGVKLGRLMNNVEQYNIAVQQFNDKINQTFGANASVMWLPKIATNNTVPDPHSQARRSLFTKWMALQVRPLLYNIDRDPPLGQTVKGQLLDSSTRLPRLKTWMNQKGTRLIFRSMRYAQRITTKPGRGQG